MPASSVFQHERKTVQFTPGLEVSKALHWSTLNQSDRNKKKKFFFFVLVKPPVWELTSRGAPGHI